ncbi:MAG: class I SAM-dependent methyltransferase [Spirochaetes bacterium]|nr:class I SAM-dependent methyltransferase [Spirochaetota bacterium]
MNNFSDFIAAIYDPLLSPFLKRVRAAVMNELSEFGEKSILDLCCGTGDQLKVLSRNGFRNLHCLDLSDSMLKIAAKGNYPITIYNKDATKTGLDSGSFDAVIISFAIHEKDSNTQVAMLNEAHRIIKENGLLLAVDFIFDERTKLPGRLGITFVEKLAGGEHYRNFRNYIKNKGLAGLINPKRFQLVKSERKFYNALTVSLFRKK